MLATILQKKCLLPMLFLLVGGFGGSRVQARDTEYDYLIEHNYSVVATGIGPNDGDLKDLNSLRFSSAFDTNFRIFKYFDGDWIYDDAYMRSVGDLNTSILRDLDLMSYCVYKCDYYDHCNGFFYNYNDGVKKSTCIGLSYLGKFAWTQTRSVSIVKSRKHYVVDPEHSISGYIVGRQSLGSSALVYLDLNLNGVLDQGERWVNVSYDGYYLFDDLQLFSYLVNQELNQDCNQTEPVREYNHGGFVGGGSSGIGGAADGFPDVAYTYYDSGMGVVGGGIGGDPHGGTKYDLMFGPGVSIIDRIKSVQLQSVTGNNTENVLILPKNSYVIFYFTDEFLLADHVYGIHVGLFNELNNEEYGTLFVSENGEDFYYMGVFDSVDSYVSFDYEEIKKYNSGFRVIRAVKVFGNSGVGITKGVPFVHLWLNHSDAVVDTYGGYFVDLYNGNHVNHINNLNFTNVCLAIDGGGDEGSGEDDGENATTTVFTTLFPFTTTSGSTTSMTTTGVVSNVSTTTSSATTVASTDSTTVASTTTSRPLNRTEASLEESFNYMLLVYIIVPIVVVILVIALSFYLKNKNNNKNRTGSARRSIESQSGNEFNREAIARDPRVVMYRNPTYVPAPLQSFNNFTNDRTFILQPSNDPNNEPIYANSHI
jgi:hypothetical protein